MCHTHGQTRHRTATNKWELRTDVSHETSASVLEEGGAFRRPPHAVATRKNPVRLAGFDRKRSSGGVRHVVFRHATGSTPHRAGGAVPAKQERRPSRQIATMHRTRKKKRIPGRRRDGALGPNSDRPSEAARRALDLALRTALLGHEFIERTYRDLALRHSSPDRQASIEAMITRGRVCKSTTLRPCADQSYSSAKSSARIWRTERSANCRERAHRARRA